jgi:Uma2 family endonuclease
LHASPNWDHQQIVMNVARAVGHLQEELAAPWRVLPGLGAGVSDTDRPEPDVVVALPSAQQEAQRDTRQVIVVFEVLSPSTKWRDLGWKRTAYPKIPSLAHDVVIAQDAVEVIVFARDENFAGRKMSSVEDTIDLYSLGVSLPLAQIYRHTNLTA